MTLLIDSGFNGITEPEVATYIAAVEAADGQLIEFAVADAINKFVQGCKNDGIWSAIKACCILAGARTLSGALVPLVGTAPTNNNFVSGDYNRKTGLLGNGSTKYLNSNRNNNADPQNSNHNAVYISSAASTTTHILGSHPLATPGANSLYNGATPSNGACFNRSDGSTQGLLTSSLSGFVGHNRNASSEFTTRNLLATNTITANSSSPADGNILVFCRGVTPASFSDARLSFYSIGESLDLAKLDTRVTNLMNALSAAIP